MYNNHAIDDSELEDDFLATVSGGGNDGSTMNAAEIDYAPTALPLVRNPDAAPLAGAPVTMVPVPVTYYSGPAAKVAVKKHGKRGKRHVVKGDDMSGVR